jgi:hypothetical protein
MTEEPPPPTEPEDFSAIRYALVAFLCPLVAWGSQFAIATSFKRQGAGFYALAAICQFFLILGGLFFGTLALKKGGAKGGGCVLLPAILGILLSVTTLAVVGFAIMGHL